MTFGTAGATISFIMGLGEIRRSGVGDPTPSSESNPYIPQFSFTASIVQRFTEKGIAGTNYRAFAANLDEYLKTSAEKEGLIAIGILAIPAESSFRVANVGHGGIQIDGVSLWSHISESARDSLDDEWIKLGRSPVTLESTWNDKVISGFMEAFFTVDYPTPEDFATVLDDEWERKQMNFLESDCEYWGIVTTEQLRKELKD